MFSRNRNVQVCLSNSGLSIYSTPYFSTYPLNYLLLLGASIIKMLNRGCKESTLACRNDTTLLHPSILLSAVNIN